MASTQNRHAAGTSALARLFHSPLWAELRRLLLLGAATYLLIALLTYSPQDPSWSTWSSRGDLRNWMGRAGSIVADLLFQGVGLSAFAAVALMALGVFKKPTERPPAKISLAFFVLSLSFVFQCVLPTSWSIWDLRNPGGVAGNLLRRGTSYVTGDMGALLLSVVCILSAFIIVFRVPIVSWVLQLIPKLFSQAQAGIKLYFTRLQTEWQATKQKLLSKKAAAAKPVTALPIGASAPTAIAPPLPNATPAKSSISASAAAHLPLAEKAEKDEEMAKLALAGRVKKPSNLPRIERPVNQDFSLPGVDMLSGKAESKQKTVDRSWYLEKAEILVQKLKDFGVEGEVVHISPGPVITVYEFKPASGVKIKEIANLSDDLTLALSVLSVRIVAPIPGKPVVGIEIPSPHREMVFFKDMILETDFYNPEVKIPIVLGRLASGEPVVTGLASMPHLLVAGSTGTGKSVFINTLISSLLYRYSPKELKLVLVDPKMVELSMYEGVPHLLLPVVIDSKKAALALRWAVDEMERRYALLHQLGVRHLSAYNEKVATLNPAENNGAHAFMPYIVVVIDEYADLMAVVAKDVELSIARLAQKARASGIHLVLATQRPSTDVVTGTIKANFPSRISFRVASSVDSKTILDRTGAERLLGNGDMLFHAPGFSTLKRMQGAFLADAELERVVNFLKSQGEPEYDERLLQAQEAGEGEPSFEDGSEGEGGGNLYDQALRLVAEKGEASISLIQRHLKIGYNRAASLMEEMEKQGVVAPASGTSKRRAVLINSI